MNNLFDYLKWRGDLSFEQSPINEIDNMILARLSSMPLHEIEFVDQETIKDVCKKLLFVRNEEFLLQDKKLCKELIKSNRYNNLRVSDFERNIDLKQECQFAAITIFISNQEIYVSYNGTDESFVGWKEDFNMSFMQHIPAQLSGLRYLERVSRKYIDANIYLGGHSKGGNIAVYSAIYCLPEIKERIINIFTADGPGFDKEVIKTEEYKTVSDKVNTYIPQSSIIGRLLEHDERYIVVKSNEKGIMQHDIYSWEVLGTKIVRSKEITKESQLVDNMLRNWLKNTTPEQRKNFVNILYELLIATEATKFSDLKTNKIKNVSNIINAYKNINEEQRKEIKQMVNLLLSSAKNSFINKELKAKK